MNEADLLNDILSSNPNEPAPKGALLLLRAEMKSEFKSIRQKLDQHDERFSCIDERFDQVDERFDKINERFEKVDGRFDKIERSLELIAQQMASLLAKSH